MPEHGFYHLTRTPLEQALPALLGRTLATGERALVLCASPDRAAALSTTLWACKDPDWLPNGTARAPGDPALHPIWLTADDENPNAARFLFQLDGRTSTQPGWVRIFDLFDGSDPEAVTAARTRWTQAKAAGHALTYWKQTDKGWSKS